MSNLLKEPFFHFLLLGGAIFALFEWAAGDSRAEIDRAEEIVVSEGRIRALSEKFSKVWQRPPTENELDGLIQGHIREEILYREALAMGLDRDDTVVRRRMRQKIEFLSEDFASVGDPGDEELQAFLLANPERFQVEPRYSFRHVYVNAEKRGSSAEPDALALLIELQESGGETSAVGDPLMVKVHFVNEGEREVSRVLGHQFAKALADCPTGSWEGPILSGFGLHLVYISERIDGDFPELSEVRGAVAREWSAEARKKSNDAFYDMLRARYTVTIVQSAPESSSPAALAGTEE